METVESPTVEPHLSSERASQLAKLAVAKRRANRDAKAEKARLLPIEGAEYVEARLLRVRAQLERVDAMLAVETDAQKLDRLASAQARLSVQEFALAGRPMPGSRRPGRESAPARRGEVGPVEPV